MDCSIQTDAFGKNANLHEINIGDLDRTLGHFSAVLRKKDGTDYGPDCL